MGCVSSSEAVAEDRSSHASKLPVSSGEGPKTKVPAKANPYQSSTRAAPTPYETELAASLVESGGKSVAYHGLLVDSGKLNPTRSDQTGNNKIFTKSVHPDDDGHIPGDNVNVPAVEIARVCGTAMTMPYTIIVSRSEAEKDVKAIVERVFDEAHKVLNGWNPSSDVSRINSAPPGKGTSVSPKLLQLFNVVDRVHSLTDGRFDPTTGALTGSFENCIKEKCRPPLPSEVKALKFGIGWRKRLERSGQKVTRKNANTIIDLDGISKGFVIDEIVEALNRQGCENCYVDWAGDVRASGCHPSGRPWRSAVIFPPELQRVFRHWQEGSLRDMLTVNDVAFFANFGFGDSCDGGSIATSGDYFSIQKYGFHHIAHPQDLTLLKARQISVASVCVAATSCAVSDAIATAAMTHPNVDSALDFLKGIRESTPDVISGYCVMSRDTSAGVSPESFTPSIFVAAGRDSSTSDTLDLSSRHDSGVDEQAISKVRTSLPERQTEVCFNGASLVVDSCSPCSMEPAPMVSFVVPATFVREASLDPTSDLNKVYCRVLGSQRKGSSDSVDSVRIDMRFRQMFDHGICMIVVAVVENVDLGSVSNIAVRYCNTVLAWSEMRLSMPRTAYNLAPPMKQAKELFRQIPSTIWILGTKSADQLDLAITATSVTIPHVLGNMLCFNIVHSSTFYAGLGGIGSRIRGHALSRTQKDLANKFVEKSSLDLDDMTSLESDSVITADCVVEKIDSVQDHIIVLARVNEVRPREGKGASDPLVWIHGEYLRY